MNKISLILEELSKINESDTIRVSYKWSDSKGKITIKDKTFKSEKDFDKWLSKMENEDGFLGIHAYQDYLNEDTWKKVGKTVFTKHGAGVIDLNFTVDGHEFCFFQFYEDDWGYMGMRDYKTEEPTDRVELYEVIDGYWKCVSNEFDKKTANKIYYNVTHKEFTFKDFINALKKEGITYKVRR